ncbi:hypothetical protein B0H11DRAFT_2029332 [Mycena galericulata]|nr:hypothetical protein B0H11DRAFT_2029332 [Mycena galericulata]
MGTKLRVVFFLPARGSPSVLGEPLLHSWSARSNRGATNSHSSVGVSKRRCIGLNYDTEVPDEGMHQKVGSIATALVLSE